MTFADALKKVSKYEATKIREIAGRAQLACGVRGIGLSRLDTEMDLTVVHATVGLRLDDMANADESNLLHDVLGIARHLNRETLELEGFFSPRYSA